LDGMNRRAAPAGRHQWHKPSCGRSDLHVVNDVAYRARAIFRPWNDTWQRPTRHRRLWCRRLACAQWPTRVGPCRPVVQMSVVVRASGLRTVAGADRLFAGRWCNRDGRNRTASRVGRNTTGSRSSPHSATSDGRSVAKSRNTGIPSGKSRNSDPATQQGKKPGRRPGTKRRGQAVFLQIPRFGALPLAPKNARIT